MNTKGKQELVDSTTGNVAELNCRFEELLNCLPNFAEPEAETIETKPMWDQIHIMLDKVVKLYNQSVEENDPNGVVECPICKQEVSEKFKGMVTKR